MNIITIIKEVVKMALQAGRKGVANDQVDNIGKIKQSILNKSSMDILRSSAIQTHLVDGSGSVELSLSDQTDFKKYKALLLVCSVSGVVDGVASSSWMPNYIISPNSAPGDEYWNTFSGQVFKMGSEPDTNYDNLFVVNFSLSGNNTTKRLTVSCGANNDDSDNRVTDFTIYHIYGMR